MQCPRAMVTTRRVVSLGASRAFLSGDEAKKRWEGEREIPGS